MEEASDGLDYEGNTNLGNNQREDGRKFIGRGFLPILGRYMYNAVGKAINQDLIGKLKCSQYEKSTIRTYTHFHKCCSIKVTVQFETEGNGQNEIVCHMDRSEAKL